MGPRGSFVVLAALLISACGSTEPLDPGAADPSPSQVSATQTSTPPDGNQKNRCISEGGPEEPPDWRPDADRYLGLTEAEANRYAQDHGQDIRVAGRDGECFALTMDYRSDRVNIYLEGNEVVAASIG